MNRRPVLSTLIDAAFAIALGLTVCGLILSALGAFKP